MSYAAQLVQQPPPTTPSVQTNNTQTYQGSTFDGPRVASTSGDPYYGGPKPGEDGHTPTTGSWGASKKDMSDMYLIVEVAYAWHKEVRERLKKPYKSSFTTFVKKPTVNVTTDVLEEFEYKLDHLTNLIDEFLIVYDLEFSQRYKDYEKDIDKRIAEIKVAFLDVYALGQAAFKNSTYFERLKKLFIFPFRNSDGTLIFPKILDKKFTEQLGLTPTQAPTQAGGRRRTLRKRNRKTKKRSHRRTR